MTKTQLAKLRKQAGLSRVELAEQLKVDYTTVYRWETGKAEISAITQMAIEAALARFGVKA